MQEEKNRSRELALERPLNYLSRMDEGLGWKMRYLLEQIDPQAQVPEEWKNLRDALQRSMVRIYTFW